MENEENMLGISEELQKKISKEASDIMKRTSRLLTPRVRKLRRKRLKEFIERGEICINPIPMFERKVLTTEV